MKPDTLERLLIDRACGELSDDVVELLEAHLAGRAEPAQEIAETVALARRALRPARPAALPAPRYAVKPRIIWRVPAWAVGMAACFLAGMTMTWWTTRPAAEPAPKTATEMAAATRTRTEVVWLSPVRMPVIKSRL